MSWKSPIEQVVSSMDMKCIQECEDKIVYEVSKTVGYTIDKETLIKALNYSKDSYEKGYAEGRNYEFNKNTEMWEKIKAEISCISTHFWTYDNTLAHKSSASIIQECIVIIDKYMEGNNDRG